MEFGYSSLNSIPDVIRRICVVNFYYTEVDPIEGKTNMNI
jgi:hypothetical protein